jgi:hypothetical protein
VPLVVQGFIGSKATKVHEGNIWKPKAFVILRALGGAGFHRLHRETAPLPVSLVRPSKQVMLVAHFQALWETVSWQSAAFGY